MVDCFQLGRVLTLDAYLERVKVLRLLAQVNLHVRLLYYYLEDVAHLDIPEHLLLLEAQVYNVPVQYHDGLYIHGLFHDKHIDKLALSKSSLLHKLQDIQNLSINGIVLLQQRVLSVERPWTTHAALVWLVLEEHYVVFQPFTNFGSKVQDSSHRLDHYPC